jgi:hypothetical protein
MAQTVRRRTCPLVRYRVRKPFFKPNRPRVFNQCAEHTSTLRQLADRPHCIVLHVHVQKLLQQTVGADHSQRVYLAPATSFAVSTMRRSTAGRERHRAGWVKNEPWIKIIIHQDHRELVCKFARFRIITADQDRRTKLTSDPHRRDEGVLWWSGRPAALDVRQTSQPWPEADERWSCNCRL